MARQSREFRGGLAPAAKKSSTLGALVVAVLGACGNLSCEDLAVGRPCEVLANDAGPQLAVYNGQALECPSRICLRPSKEPAVAKTVDTGPSCTAECSKDKDCEDGLTRGKTNPAGCKSKWVCGIAFEVGPLCCKKLCMCQDFLPGPPQTPASCNAKSGVASCQNLKN